MFRSDCQGKFIEDHAELAAVWDVGGDVIVAAAEIRHERMPGGEDRAGRCRVRPRIGRSRAVSRR